jgi:crossover junction endodeoxyribonuclease RuvC
MIVLGLDDALENTGWCVLADGLPVATGLITTKKKHTYPERLNQIFNEVLILIEKYEPDYLAIEDKFLGRSVKTLKQLAGVRGILLLMAARQGLDTWLLQPTQVKEGATGKGNASKIEVEEAMRAIASEQMQHEISQLKKRDDVWDAIAVAYTAYHAEINGRSH